MSHESEKPADDKTNEPAKGDAAPYWLDEKPHPSENSLAFHLVRFAGFERVKP